MDFWILGFVAVLIGVVFMAVGVKFFKDPDPCVFIPSAFPLGGGLVIVLGGIAMFCIPFIKN